jgi:serine/threonine-protein kinase
MAFPDSRPDSNNRSDTGSDFSVGTSGLGGTFASVGSTTQRRGKYAKNSRARRVAFWIAAIVSLLLLLTTLLIGHRVRQSMRRVNRTSIETIRNANVAAMEIWLEGRAADAAASMSDARIQASARRILEDTSKEAPTAHRGAATKSSEHMAGLNAAGLNAAGYDAKDFFGWCLFDANGKVAASSHSKMIGMVLPLATDTKDRIDRSEATVTRPFTCPISLEDYGRFATPDRPLMLAISPISQGITSLGGFALMIDPLNRFCELLQTAQIGESCETIAVDGNGLFITRSRFESHFVATGAIDASTSVLNLHARVPESAKLVTEGDETEPSLFPLTEAADQATRGATGSNLSGYQDYRGKNVIGTWYWVPQYGFAVVTKIDYDEAYGPMRVLRNSFALLLGVVLMTSLGLFAMAAIIRRFTSAQNPARRLGQYELKGTLDIGGAGKVYLARHESLQRDVAIKVLEFDAVNPHSFSRFEREVQLTAKLRHPNTVEVYDFGQTEEGTFFYVMQYVQGISLASLIERYGRQSPHRVIHILQQVCWSLVEAHDRGMVHRDIKPGNILLSSQPGVYDLVKVLDFGLVRDLSHDSVQLTQFASITGTPSYMSPEAVRDASTADQRSDIYSLGAVGYHLLCGVPVFSGENAADTCAKQLHEIPVSPQQRLKDLNTSTGQGVAPESVLPQDLVELLMLCLEKDPQQRPSSMSDFAERLARCSDACDWTSAKARDWWEKVATLELESPRDVAGDFADNGDPQPSL